jgi:hypothetical protein
MEIFIQEKEECNGVIVIAGTTSFEVKEKASGSSNAKFSYRILAKRKSYQDHRFGIDANQPLEDRRDKQTYQQAPIIDIEEMKGVIAKATIEKETLKKKGAR